VWIASDWGAFREIALVPMPVAPPAAPSLSPSELPPTLPSAQFSSMVPPEAFQASILPRLRRTWNPSCVPPARCCTKLLSLPCRRGGNLSSALVGGHRAIGGD